MHVARVRVAPFLSSKPLLNIPMAVQFIRKMRGSSQPALIRCTDDKLYVVKFSNNLQGPNVLANEVMGSELFLTAGLPTPSWSPLYLSASFIRQYPEMSCNRWGESFPVGAGFHFGSSFLGQEQGGTLFDFLPTTFLSRISNQLDFLRVLIFDVWLNHCDVRQAVFVNPPSSRAVHAVFVDHGHLFGGPAWTAANKPGQAKCLERRLYPMFQESDIEDWITYLESAMPPVLDRLTSVIPKIWYSGDLEALVVSLRVRLRTLRELFSEEMGLDRRHFLHTHVGSVDA